MFKWKGHTFLHWEIISKCKSAFMKFKNLLLLNYWVSQMYSLFWTGFSVRDVAHGPLVCLFWVFFFVYKNDFDVSILNYLFEETYCRRHGLYFYNVDIYLKYFIIENIYISLYFVSPHSYIYTSSTELHIVFKIQCRHWLVLRPFF